MMLYNSQLDTFIQVAKAGSFSGAAKVLGVTPTAIIKQMNSLEARLDLTLFHRSRQGLTLTHAGEVLLKDAEQLVDFSHDALKRARQAQQLEADKRA